MWDFFEIANISVLSTISELKASLAMNRKNVIISVQSSPKLTTEYKDVKTIQINRITLKKNVENSKLN